jgi:preprotein translocase subunit SecG
MSGFLSILIILVCVLLILIVLVQNSKGGGLSSSFSSNNQIMGVRKTADVLEKATWGFAIALFVFSLLASPKKQAVSDTPDTGTESVSRKKAEGMVAAPVNPGQAPAANGVQQTAPPANNSAQPAGNNKPAGK